MHQAFKWTQIACNDEKNSPSWGAYEFRGVTGMNSHTLILKGVVTKILQTSILKGVIKTDTILNNNFKIIIIFETTLLSLLLRIGLSDILH